MLAISIILLIISILFIGVAKIISRNVKKQKIKHKIQPGKITYSDLNKPAKPFFSNRYKIAGKPDYVIMKDNSYIPVEVKTGRRNEPQKNHILQLAAYCQLIEENYGSFVPYGILVYNNTYQYKIPFDPKIRFELETTVKKMRKLLKTGGIERNHSKSNRCKNCSMKIYCDNKLF